MAVLPIPHTPLSKFHEEFVEFNGANFKTVSWKVPSNIQYKGKVFFVHGFSESAPLYTEFFDNLSQDGYEVFFFEQRGAGDTSPGKLAGRTNEKHVFDDLNFFLKRELDARTDKNEKFFLMGHLMGGGIVLNYGVNGKYVDQIKAIATTGPLVILHPNTEPNIILRTFAPLVSSLLPNWVFDSELRYEYITSNQKWIDYIKSTEAPLIGTARQFQDMFVRGRKLLDKRYVSDFKVPVLILHGEDDNINWIKGSAEFVDLIPSSVDKELFRLENARHSLCIESEEIYQVFYKKLLSFLNSH